MSDSRKRRIDDSTRTRETDTSSVDSYHYSADVVDMVIPFAQFVPLIKDVADILSKINELYSTAQHNKRIVKILMERISAANSIISILREDSLYTKSHYASLRRFIQVIQNMKKYCEDITQYNTLQKYLVAKTIQSKFKDLCSEYESSMIELNLHITIINFNINVEKENKILQEEISDLLHFQSALVESMNDKVHTTMETMDTLVEKVSEMAITMQSLNDKHVKQEKIDNIFNQPLLPFDGYDEIPDESRSDGLRKYINIKTRQDYAFKIIHEKCLDQIKNQVTILKKLKEGCQHINIIHFYGLIYDGSKYYLVTEWAENRNLREYINYHGQDIKVGLRIGFAHGIARGLNFLNAVKIVHRDIRAENIVITEYNVAKITNFKSSRSFYDDTRKLAVNEDRIRYSAPEILRRMLIKEGEENHQKYDTKCEVYSFGIILWEIAECRVPYEEFEDFTVMAKNVASGYRESFTPGTDIPSPYQNLVIRAVDQNPGLRPTFANILTELQNLKNTTHKNGTNHPGRKQPMRKMHDSKIDAAEDALLPIDKVVDKAVEDHKTNAKDKKILYKIFDNNAELGVPKAKYWKAYFILKGWSDLPGSEEEKYKIALELLKEAADYGDDFPDAQLRYATMVMKGEVVEKNEKEAIEYFKKASKNGQPVAKFNLGTYYYSNDNEELGRFYLASAASKGYEQAIQFCKSKGIAY